MSVQSNTTNIDGLIHSGGVTRKRGRPPNLLRDIARAAGLKTLSDEACFVCGCTERYVNNAQCVDCAIAAGQARYAAQDDSARADQKRRDHERYLRRPPRPVKKPHLLALGDRAQNRAVMANIGTKSKAVIADVLRYADDIAQRRIEHDLATFAALVNEAITLSVLHAMTLGAFAIVYSQVHSHSCQCAGTNVLENDGALKRSRSNRIKRLVQRL
jgi:hypothetical protein